jgi:bifunctional non-homologous end joining protein LigD
MPPSTTTRRTSTRRAATAGEKLREYRRKRNFAATPEPTGDARAKRRKSKAKVKLPMFCVQKHLASSLHYDFRLEHKGVLLSWAVPKGPSLNPADKRLAMQTEDHPLDYGDFEGVIPEGYGAGIVVLWDRGTWEPEVDDIDRAIEKGDLKFRLNGVKLKGSWVLVRTRGYSSGGPSRSWLLIKHRDEWAGDVDVTGLFPLSVKSSRDFAEILASDKPQIWESNRPGGGGASGKLMRQLLQEAAELRAARKNKPTKRTTARAKTKK